MRFRLNPFRRLSNPIPIANGRYARGSAKTRRFPVSPFWIFASLAMFLTVYFWNDLPSLTPSSRTLPLAAPSPAPVAGSIDRENARFAHCAGARRTTCVVDGDTFWYEGRKIRIADINAPETSTPSCPHEAQLGARATARMTELLNQGPFSLQAWSDGRDTDRYGRALRVVTRGGRSLGEVLVSEGLAERWKGYRGDWC